MEGVPNIPPPDPMEIEAWKQQRVTTWFREVLVRGRMLDETANVIAYAGPVSESTPPQSWRENGVAAQGRMVAFEEVIESMGGQP